MPIRAIHVVALALYVSYVVGCGGSTEADHVAVATPTAADIAGDWRNDYITAGAVSRHTRLRFGKLGELAVVTESTQTFTDPPSVAAYEGRYDVTTRGTVTYSWGDSARIEAENSLTFVEGRALEDGHPCCALAGTTRWWSHRGYLAEDRARTRFHRDSMRRTIAVDGVVDSFIRTSVDLIFRAPPADLVEREDCTFDVAIHVEAMEAGAIDARDFVRTLPCSVAEDGMGLVVILVSGTEAVDGQSLADSPYLGRTAWVRLLEEQAEITSWSETLRAALSDAFELYLAFDRARPDVLFHYLDTNRLDITGYGWVAPGM